MRVRGDVDDGESQVAYPKSNVRFFPALDKASGKQVHLSPSEGQRRARARVKVRKPQPKEFFQLLSLGFTGQLGYNIKIHPRRIFS